MKIVVVDLPDCEQSNLRFSLENGYPERPELWVNSTLAASPEELQKVLRRAEEEWKEISKDVEERK